MSDSNDDNNQKKPDQDAHLNLDDKTHTSHSNIPSESLAINHPKQIGRYTIQRVIASGGMGTVYEA